MNQQSFPMEAMEAFPMEAMEAFPMEAMEAESALAELTLDQEYFPTGHKEAELTFEQQYFRTGHAEAEDERIPGFRIFCFSCCCSRPYL
jgi:hypothetical protein